MKTKRILIFDDEPASVVGIQRVLKNRGIEAEICTQGQRAEDFCISFRPDLALLDLVWERQPVSASDIEAILNARGIPFVFLSAHVPVLTAPTLSPKVIHKPTSPEQVIVQLEEWGY